MPGESRTGLSLDPVVDPTLLERLTGRQRRCAVDRTHHGSEEGSIDGAELRVDVGWIHLVRVLLGGGSKVERSTVKGEKVKRKRMVERKRRRGRSDGSRHACVRGPPDWLRRRTTTLSNSSAPREYRKRRCHPQQQPSPSWLLAQLNSESPWQAAWMQSSSQADCERASAASCPLPLSQAGVAAASFPISVLSSDYGQM